MKGFKTGWVLSLVLAVALMLPLLPQAQAEEIDWTKQTCEHCNSETNWTAWDGTAGLTESGHYYLNADVVLEQTQKLEGVSVCLHLNGKKLSAKYQVLDVGEGSTLNVLDHEDNAGKIIGFSASEAKHFESAYGGTITLKGGASLNIYNGTITQTNLDQENCGKQGGCIYGAKKSAITMNGGVVTGGVAENGGNIYTFGSFVMNGGTITKGKAKMGGNIYVYGPTTIINDGLISAGKTTGAGGNIYVISQREVTINGGTISKGNSGSYGGNIYVARKVVLNVYGGTIIDGKATNMGGNLHTYTDTVVNVEERNGSVAFVGGVAGRGGSICLDDTTLNFRSGMIVGGACSPTVENYGGGNIYLLRDLSRLNMSQQTGRRTLIADGVSLSGAGGNIQINGGKVNITGGTVENGVGGNIFNERELTISGGTIRSRGGHYGITTSLGATTTITGGDITAGVNNTQLQSDVVAVGSATVKISGGKVGSMYVDNYSPVDFDTTVRISGNAVILSLDKGTAEDGAITIGSLSNGASIGVAGAQEGGLVGFDGNAKYFNNLNGFVATQGADGLQWTKVAAFVMRNGAVVQGYETAQAAVDAAGAGDIVRLCGDVSENLSADKDLTLDLAGHSISGTVTMSQGSLSGIGTGKIAKVTGTVATYVSNNGKVYFAVKNDGGVAFEQLVRLGKIMRLTDGTACRKTILICSDAVKDQIVAGKYTWDELLSL